MKQPAPNDNKSNAAPTGVKETVSAEGPQTKTDKPAQPRSGLDVGPVHVVPYGTIYFNLFGSHQQNNNHLNLSAAFSF
jgi:hypothetical protein